MIGDRIRVRAGDRICSDGRVVEGSTTVDEQLVTGESWPAQKAIGDSVFGGTLNLDGSLVVELTAAPSEGSIQRLIRAVNEARAEKDATSDWPNARRRGFSSS